VIRGAHLIALSLLAGALLSGCWVARAGRDAAGGVVVEAEVPG